MCIRDRSGWVWLEKPDEDEDDVDVCGDDDCVDCEEEGWYWFAKDGKMYNKGGQKKIDGRYYYFNEHGQMPVSYTHLTYYTVTEQMDLALANGVLALQSAVAIVLGIVVVFELPQRFFRGVIK